MVNTGRRLIIRPGAIGDFIVAIPSMRRLRVPYLEVWAASPNLPLARFADRAQSIVSTGLDLLGIGEPPAGLLDRLRSFDSIVSWYGSNRPEFRRLVESLNLPIRFFDALPLEDSGVHAVDFYLEQTRAMATCDSDPVPRIECHRQARMPAPVVIHPFAGSRKKCWPLARFQELGRRLELRAPVEWCAGFEDELREAVRIENLYELGCWLSRARVYVGNDSGVTHLAAAAGAPVVALFGPTNPAVWAPRGRKVSVVAAESMDRISVDQVQEAVEGLW